MQRRCECVHETKRNKYLYAEWWWTNTCQCLSHTPGWGWHSGWSSEPFLYLFWHSLGFFPRPFPALWRGLVWEVGACWTKLLCNYQGCRGGMGTGWLGRINEQCGERGGISLNTEWVKLTSGEGRRQPEAEKRRWQGTICALSHIHCCLLKLEGCEQKQNLI